jgi:hypothetical protein
MAGTRYYGNEALGSIECREVLDCLKTHLLFKNISAPWSVFVHNYK